MAGMNLGEVQIVLERGTPRPTGTAVYFVVDDADELFEFQRDTGVTGSRNGWRRCSKTWRLTSG